MSQGQFPYGYPPAGQPPVPKKTKGCLGGFFLTAALFLGFFVAIFLFSDVDSDYISVVGDSVGIVRIEEPITDSKKIVKIIDRFRKTDSIKAIVLRLDTPGGGVGASEEIYRAAKQAADKGKPVIASMGSMAASGGYYIAMASSHIVATSGTITGSIGVVAPNFNLTETLDKIGVRSQTITSGEHKDTGSPFAKMTEADKTLLQGVIFDMYKQFFRVILESRHDKILTAWKNKDKVENVLNSAGTKGVHAGKEWDAFTTGTVASELHVPVETETALRRMADGRIYTGEQAYYIGLVDQIGTLEDAVKYAGKIADLGDNPVTVDRSPKSDISGFLGGEANSFLREFLATNPGLEFRHQ